MPIPRIPYDVIQAFDAGSGALDGTEFAAGVHGASWGTWGVSPDVTITHTVRQDHSVALPFEIDVAGTIYDGTEASGATFDHSGNPSAHDRFRLQFTSNTYNVVQGLVVVRPAIIDAVPNLTDYYNDILSFEEDGGFGVAQVSRTFTGSTRFRAHASGGNGRVFAMDPAVFTCLFVQHDLTTGITEVVGLSLDGTFLGSSVGTHGSSGYIVNAYWQDYLRYSGVNKTGAIDTKLVALRTDVSEFPPLPISIPAPTQVVCRESIPGTVTVAWSSLASRVRVERRVDGGSWTTIAADTTATTLDDAGRTNGTLVEYRITPRVGTQEGSAAIFGPILIGDGTPAGLWLTGPTSGYGITEINSWAGGRIVVGSYDLEVTALGMWVTGSLQANPMNVRLYASDGSTQLATVNVATNGTPNQFAYTDLDTPITLTAGTTYNLVANYTGWRQYQYGAQVTSAVVSVPGRVTGTPGSFTYTADAGRIDGALDMLFRFPADEEPEGSGISAVTFLHYNRPFAFELVSAGTTAVELNPTLYLDKLSVNNQPARVAVVSVETQPIRWRIDGANPTDSIGHVTPVGGVIELTSLSAIANFRAITASGTASLSVTYYGS